MANVQMAALPELYFGKAELSNGGAKPRGGWFEGAPFGMALRGGGQCAFRQRFAG